MKVLDVWQNAKNIPSLLATWFEMQMHPNEIITKFSYVIFKKPVEIKRGFSTCRIPRSMPLTALVELQEHKRLVVSIRRYTRYTGRFRKSGPYGTLAKAYDKPRKTESDSQINYSHA